MVMLKIRISKIKIMVPDINNSERISNFRPDRGFILKSITSDPII